MKRKEAGVSRQKAAQNHDTAGQEIQCAPHGKEIPLLSRIDFAQQGTERDDDEGDKDDGDDPHGRPPLNRGLNLFSLSRSWEASLRFMLFFRGSHEPLP